MRDVLNLPSTAIDFADWYRRNRERSTMLFDLVDAQAYASRPIPLRHPVLFYEGHLPAFSFITLARDTMGIKSVDPELERLFQRGIDPADAKAAEAATRSSWPERDEILAFGKACDEVIVGCLRQAQSAPPGSRAVQAAYTILEHEQMHHETLLYIYHRVPLEHKRKPSNGTAPSDGALPRNEVVRVAAGAATLGAKRDGIPFGWDNEFEEQRVDVPAFSVDAHSVTNADYLEFVKAGGPPPPFWVQRGDVWRILGMFEELPFRRSWPVYATRDQAIAYATWKNARLMTEAEYHRAAFGTPGGEERALPWGDGAPSARFGAFDWSTWDPEPAGSHPDGASAWGINDLIGNGWEWTATPFGPLPGFTPMVTYPQYSADFFDDLHFVVKGGSPVTARELIRRSLRNWYRSAYPYIYAKFRCVR